jgi:hypothetical protein
MKTRFTRSALALAAGLGLGTPAGAAITVDSDPVLFWNDLAIKTVGGNPLVQSRVMAILNTAMHDAVNRTYNGANNYYNQGVSAPGGNARAAASMAARDVLVAINGGNPMNVAAYDAALAANLAKVSNNNGARTNGMMTGSAYATAMLSARTGDGSVAPPGFSYTPGNLPGQWRPTPPGFGAAAVPHWGGVKPFLIDSVASFRPAAPPTLDSAEYLAAYNEVKVIGSANATLAERSADQTASALFWDASNGTTWHRIAVDVIADEGKSTLENARIMAKVSAAVADSLTSGFDIKYLHNLWRPVTAIREGDNDGVDATVGDAGWSPLFGTPAHPSYVSTHSMQSGAASAVLLGLGIDEAFTNVIGPDTRMFTSIGQAAQDAADSRLWGGIHFRFDNEIGLSTGQAIGQFALAQDAFNAVPEPASWAMMIAGFGLAGAAVRRRVRVVAFA